jgi:dihydropyrimidine dehydrogenase (NAD+) subunit PreT
VMNRQLLPLLLIFPHDRSDQYFVRVIFLQLTMVADKIILAVGQHARLDAFAELEPQRNTIKTQNYQTRDPQVFAAGDIVEGDKTVVYAVKTGKEAAEAIHHYLEGACSC